MFTTTAQTTTYNGWTNFETWRINLEMFDGFDVSDVVAGFRTHLLTPETLTQWKQEATDYVASLLEDQAHEYIEMDCPSKKGLAYDLACDFLRRVDWEEIAQHMVDDYVAESR